MANFPSALLRQALALNIAPLACDQVEHHALLPQAPLLAVTGPADMVLTSYTPLGKGEVPAHPVFGPIAAKHGATRAQVALAWAMAQGRVAVIPKAASAARQLENFGASRVALDAADIAAISAIQTRKRYVDPAFAPEWDG